MTIQELIDNLSQVRDKAVVIITEEEYARIMLRLINNMTDDRNYYRDEFNELTKE